MSSTFWQDQLDAVEALIAAYNAMFLAFVTNGAMHEYTLDTGQTVTKVKRSELSAYKSTLDGLLNQYATLHARCNGSGVTRVLNG